MLTEWYAKEGLPSYVIYLIIAGLTQAMSIEKYYKPHSNTVSYRKKINFGDNVKKV